MFYVGNCAITVNRNVGTPSPVLVHPGTVQTIRPVDKNGQILVNYNAGIQLSCPGSNNYLKVKGNGYQDVTAICVGGTTFSIDGKEYEFQQLTCQKVLKGELYSRFVLI